MKAGAKKKMGWLAKILLGIAGLVFLSYLLCAVMIFSLRSINPPTTMVMLQRRVGAAIAKRN